MRNNVVIEHLCCGDKAPRAFALVQIIPDSVPKDDVGMNRQVIGPTLI
jgi:hypothetical protein